jgi:hypothetical protein
MLTYGQLLILALPFSNIILDQLLSLEPNLYDSYLIQVLIKNKLIKEETIKI